MEVIPYIVAVLMLLVAAAIIVYLIWTVLGMIYDHIGRWYL